MSRGASRAVARTLNSDEARTAYQEAHCLACGSVLDFDRPDPLALGRTMQGCSNRMCPDHRARPVPRRVIAPATETES